MMRTNFNYRRVFDDEPGLITAVQHTITLTPKAKPVRQAQYRLPPEEIRWLKVHIDIFLKDGRPIIEDSTPN